MLAGPTGIEDDGDGVSPPSVPSEERDRETALEALVAKSKPAPLMDPEKVDPKGVPTDVLQYWMKLRGVGEHTAAVLHTAGFTDFEQLASTAPDDIAVKTGLPYKFSGKIHAETAKIVGS